MNISAQARTLAAITDSLTFKNEPGGASVMDCSRSYAVFDKDGNTVADFWCDRNSDAERDVARRRAHALRQTLDQE